MKLSQSNFNLRSPDCYLVRNYLIATVNLRSWSEVPSFLFETLLWIYMYESIKFLLLQYRSLIKKTILDTYFNKLFRFKSSSGDWTSLAEYVERMKDKQEQIFYIAGQSEQEVTGKFCQKPSISRNLNFPAKKSGISQLRRFWK